MSLGDLRTRLLGLRARATTPLVLTLVDQGMVSACNFGATLLLARFLGPTLFGQFSLFYIVILLAGLIQNAALVFPMLSLSPVLSREDGRYFEKGWAAATILAGGFFITSLAGSAIAHRVFPSSIPLQACVPFAVALGGYLLQDFIRRAFFMQGRATGALYSDFVSYAVQLVILLLLRRRMTPDLALCIIGSTSLAAAGIGWLLSPVKRPSARGLKAFLLRHWDTGKWLTLSNLSQWIGSQGLLFAAGVSLGTIELGGARAVINVGAPASVLFQGLQNYLPAKAGTVFATSGSTATISYLRQWSRGLAALVFALGLAVAYAGRTALALAYGHAYERFSALLFWQTAYVTLCAAALPLNILHRTLETSSRLAMAQIIATPFAVIAFMSTRSMFSVHALFIGLVMGQGVALILVLVPHRAHGIVRTTA